MQGTVQFGAMSAAVGRDAQRVLDPLAALLRARPALRVRVEGHTCNAPSWGMTNQQLSLERSNAVVGALQAAGVASRLATVGCGEKLPRSTSDRASNRRVEFHIQQSETVSELRDLLRKEPARLLREPTLPSLAHQHV